MIYEKMNGGICPTKNRDSEKNGVFCVSEKSGGTGEKKALPENENKILSDSVTAENAAENEKISFAAKRKSRLTRGKNRRKKRRKLRFAVLAFSLFFCLRSLDERVLDGALKERIRTAVAKGLLSAYEAVSGENPINENACSELDVYGEKAYFLTENEKEKEAVSLSDTETEEEKTSEAEKNDAEKAINVMWGAETEIEYDGEKYFPITTKDLSAKSVFSVSNGTSYNPNMEEISKKEPVALENLTLREEEPTVLIVHTHATECYTEHEEMYPESEAVRSEDIEKNVVRLGGEIAKVLESYGIGVVHSTRLCDAESFIDAYNVSYDEVKTYLEKYPSIRVVIDVHRDAIIKESGEGIRPATEIAGQNYAQLMFVVGTGESAHRHDGWENNLSLALKIQREASSRYPGLFRSVNLRSVPFNQWLSEGYLLLEVGSCSNTLEEAIRSATAFGHSLSVVIKEAASE